MSFVYVKASQPYVTANITFCCDTELIITQQGIISKCVTNTQVHCAHFASLKREMGTHAEVALLQPSIMANLEIVHSTIIHCW